MLCCIQNGIEKTLLMSEPTFIVFIDYSKASESVSHFPMFNILNDMGFPRHLGAIKTSTGSRSEDIKTRIGRAKKATMELDTIWKDRGIRKELKLKLVKALIWPVISYGAEGWTLKKDDERRLEAAEMWCYRRMLRISWTEKRTNKSIQDEFQTRRDLLAQIIKRKMAFFGNACRNNKCNLVKTCILGMMSWRRRRGAPGCIDNINKWTRTSLEENGRLTEDITAWRERIVQLER